MDSANLGQILPFPVPTNGKPASLKKSRKPASVGKRRRKLTAFAADRHFWPHVDTSAGPDACHPWTGQIDEGNGYGRLFNIEGLPYVHRKAWEVAHGRKVPKGKCIAHACHNKRCCNPDHLHPRTHRQNVAETPSDRCRRRLTVEQVGLVVAMRFRNAMKYSEIAATFGVSHQTVASICRGRTHSKITGIVRTGKPGSQRPAATVRQLVQASATAGAVV